MNDIDKIQTNRETYTIGKGIYKLATVIAGLGCLVASIWLWWHGIHNGWIIALGVVGTLELI